MHWIIQENLFKENEWENLLATLERFDIPYSVHKVIPFVGELVPEPVIDSAKVICFGSYSMRHTARNCQWAPGVYDLCDADFVAQRERWGERMLNFDSQVLRFEDAKLSEPVFIRPIEDTKYFAGKVFEVAEFEEWQRNVCVLEHDYGNSLTKDTYIQLCSPKTIFSEHRFWVVDGRIVCASQYKIGDRVLYASSVDQCFYDFVNECIAIWQPHRAFVIDVCDTPEGLKVVEINTINAAGFYAGDIQQIVMALETMEEN